VAAVACVALWVRYLERRDRLRHAWRLELVQARGIATKSEDVESLKVRVGRLELKGVSR
jgi:hypothetical protein